MKTYLANLDRALANLPKIKSSGERFIVQEPRLISEGKATVFENFTVITDKLRREPDHLLKFIVRELGTAGKFDGQRLSLQGKFTTSAVTGIIYAYVQEYVTCSECGRPDTHLIKNDRIMTLRCDACGAHRPVAKRNTNVSIIKEDALKEGETYDVIISSVGRKGDGIAKRDKYTIYVPGVVKGDSVKIKIKKITGNLAFADLIEKNKK